jgi:hypothetical protein
MKFLHGQNAKNTKLSLNAMPIDYLRRRIVVCVLGQLVSIGVDPAGQLRASQGHFFVRLGFADPHGHDSFKVLHR